MVKLSRSGPIICFVFARKNLMNDRLEQARCETPWMMPAEAAAYLGISLGTLRNWTSQRTIPFAKRGRVVRYQRKALDHWLVTGTGQPDPSDQPIAHATSDGPGSPIS
jgi:excisionase family DNA binding protein